MLALVLAGHYVRAETRTPTMADPQSPLYEDRIEHHNDLDNRADLLGVEQDILRGATNFTDPGYRDMPNAAQMQLQHPVENDHRRAATKFRALPEVTQSSPQ